MKHLLGLKNNIKNYEQGKVKSQNTENPKPISKRHAYVCCKINGYWFRLTKSQWSAYTKLKYATILARLKTPTIPIKVALGLEELVKRKSDKGHIRIDSKRCVYCQINGYWFRMTMAQWARFTGINYFTLQRRLRTRKSIRESLELDKYEPNFAKNKR